MGCSLLSPAPAPATLMQQTEAIPGGLGQAHIWPGVPRSQLGPKAFWEEEEGEEAESDEGRRASSRLPWGSDHLWGGALDNSRGKPCHLVGGRRCLLLSRACPLPHQAGKGYKPAPQGLGPISAAWCWARALVGALRSDGSLCDPSRSVDPGWGLPSKPPLQPGMCVCGGTS